MSAGHAWVGVGRTTVRLHWEEGSALSVRTGESMAADVAQCQACGLLVAHVAQWDGEQWQRATGHGIDLDSLVLGRPPRCAPLHAEAA